MYKSNINILSVLKYVQKCSCGNLFIAVQTKTKTEESVLQILRLYSCR